MRTLRWILLHGLLGLALLGVAHGAAASKFGLQELGSGVAIPFLTGPDLMTKAVLTNVAAADRVLHFDVINGDPGENWDVESFQCTLTAGETVEISFVGGDTWVGGSTNAGTDFGGDSWIRFECDRVEGVNQEFGGDAGSDGTIASNASRGVLWVTVQNDHGHTLANNVLFADFSIFNLASGMAASSNAASVQGVSNDGDRKYEFNGSEYLKFAAASATNFRAPLGTESFLLIFTLDGVTGAPPTVRVRVLWYDDDEHVEDDAFEFKCFDLVHYEDIAPGLASLETAGHIELLPVPSALEPARPFVCYNYQDGTLRPCATSTSYFDRIPSPSLDTQL
jgi:hypothetical protein